MSTLPSFPFHRVAVLGLALAAALPLQPAQGAAPEHQMTWRTVGDSTLARLRGGFAVGNDLMVTIGISRALYINGALVTESSLYLGQPGQFSAGQAAQLAQQLQALSLVQIGPGNTFVPAAAAPVVQAAATGTATPPAGITISSVPGTGPGLVIQNTLNNQQIASHTVIDASTNGLSLVWAAQLQDQIMNAVQQALSSGR